MIKRIKEMVGQGKQIKGHSIKDERALNVLELYKKGFRVQNEIRDGFNSVKDKQGCWKR